MCCVNYSPAVGQKHDRMLRYIDYQRFNVQIDRKRKTKFATSCELFIKDSV